MRYDFAEIKSIPITAFLERLGVRPTKENSEYSFYMPPYRQDNHSSFKVSKKKNRWYDLATMESGDIIDLGKLIYGTSNIIAVIERIHDYDCNIANIPKEQRGNENEETFAPFMDVKSLPLSERHLLSYLVSRGIDLDVAIRYCTEIHYRLGPKEYYALAFENVRHGFEARNISFKGTIGPKDISLLRQHEANRDITIFENYMDFLSYLTLCKKGDILGLARTMDFLVLNSVSNLRRAMSWLEHYQSVTCCLDNDDAGRKVVDTLGEARDGVYDVSRVYTGYRNLNDFLRKKPYCP